MRRFLALVGVLVAVGLLFPPAPARADTTSAAGRGALSVPAKNASASVPNLKIVLGLGGKGLEITPDLPIGTRYRFRKPQLAADGSATAVLIYVTADDLPEVEYKISISANADPTPNPPVPPPPVPPVPPNPSGWAWLVVVRETSTVAPDIAQMLDDQELLAAVRAKSGNDLQKVDPSDPGPYRSYAEHAAGKAEPYGIMVKADGTIVWEGPFPTTKIEAMALIGKSTVVAR